MTLARIMTRNQGIKAGRQFTELLGTKKWIWVDGEKASNDTSWRWSDGTLVEQRFTWQKVFKKPKTDPRRNMDYVALHQYSGRMMAHHGDFFLPTLCQCERSATLNQQPQQDYGLINSNGQYVVLFRSPTIGSSRGGVVLRSRKQQNRYTYHRQRVTHGVAQEICRGRGGDLACPRSLEQQQKILKVIINTVSVQKCLIGAN